jgi:serine/threonine protein kinase
MVMEHADQDSLRVFMRKGKTLSWNVKLKLSLDISRGLQYLHHREIIHRDLVNSTLILLSKIFNPMPNFLPTNKAHQ